MLGITPESLSRLRNIVIANAIFSSTSGLLLIIFYKTIANWFGQQNEIALWILRIGLLLFSYTVFIEIKN
jgi:hypothetical protein